MKTQEIREMEKRVEMYRRLLIWNIVFLLGLLCWGSMQGQLKITNQALIDSNQLSSFILMKEDSNRYFQVSLISDTIYYIDRITYDTRLRYLDKSHNVIWEKDYGGIGRDELLDVVKTGNSSYILYFWSNSPTSKNKTVTSDSFGDYWLVKIDTLGNIIWQKNYGGNHYESGQYNGNYQGRLNIINTNDGNYIFVGSSISNISKSKSQNGKGGGDVWIVKVDSLGNKLWDKTLGGESHESGIRIIQSVDSSLLIIASSYSDSSGDKTQKSFGSYDIWLIRLDNNGNTLWEKSYGGIGNDYPVSINELSDKSILIGAASTSPISGNKSSKNRGNSTDFWVIKLNSNGDILKQYSYGGYSADFLSEIIVEDTAFTLYGESFSNAGGDKSENSRGGLDLWIIKIDTNGAVLWDKTFGGGQNENEPYIYKESNGYRISCISGSGLTGDKTSSVIGHWILDVIEYSKKIKGSVFPDFNSNCIYNKSTEFNIPKILIYNKTENTYSITNDNIYTMYLFDRDTAVLKIINLDSNLYVACGKDSIVVDMTGKPDTSGIDFPIRSNKTGHCINITSFSSGLLRPGRWGDYQLNYQNNAFDTAYNAYIEIEVDTAAIDSIKSPYSFTLTGNVLRFNLGHVQSFGFSSITYSVKLKTTVIIGSSHIHRAKVFPICNLYPSTVYDSSEIQPMMRCLPNDTVEFTLKNIGSKNQSDWGYSIIYVDELILKTDSFKLTVGNSRVFKYKLDTNKVFTAEVFNSNFHPVTPILIRHNDLCANKRPMIPQNAALNFSRHDEAKEYEEACTIVRGSYDPNIKSVLPVGMFAEHYTSTGTELKYRIDFQNTGTDTAFRVVLVDTLSSFLDIASFVPGVSSHPYTVEFGGRAVKFIFDPIRLIDSGTNEPASHGYVHFKIKHIAGINPKTKIENKADIYFDYNAPIRTNTVFNTIFDTIQIYVPKDGSAIAENDKTSVIVFPNPTTDKFFIQMSEPVKDLSIEMYDMQGRMITTVSSPNNQTVEVSAQGMTKGIYHIRCMSGEKVIVVKKVKVE